MLARIAIVTTLLVGVAHAQTTGRAAKIRAEKGNLMFASPDGSVTFEGADAFNIQTVRALFLCSWVRSISHTMITAHNCTRQRWKVCITAKNIIYA